MFCRNAHLLVSGKERRRGMIPPASNRSSTARHNFSLYRRNACDSVRPPKSQGTSAGLDALFPTITLREGDFDHAEKIRILGLDEITDVLTISPLLVGGTPGPSTGLG